MPARGRRAPGWPVLKSPPHRHAASPPYRCTHRSLTASPPGYPTASPTRSRNSCTSPFQIKMTMFKLLSIAAVAVFALSVGATVSARQVVNPSELVSDVISLEAGATHASESVSAEEAARIHEQLCLIDCPSCCADQASAHIGMCVLDNTELVACDDAVVEAVAVEQGAAYAYDAVTDEAGGAPNLTGCVNKAGCTSPCCDGTCWYCPDFGPCNEQSC
eukprot:jgi/Ulvmu1/12406/UM009_0055.1